MPNAEHSQCAKHIHENFWKHFSGVAFRNLFCGAAKATYPAEFEEVVDEVMRYNHSSYGRR